MCSFLACVMCSFLACVMCSFLACVLCSSSATARPSAAACTWLQVVPGGGVEIMGVQTHGIGDSPLARWTFDFVELSSPPDK